MRVNENSEKDLQLHVPYIVDIAKRYTLSFSRARVLFNALQKLSDCQSLREIDRVHSLCFYADPDNGALRELYVVMSTVLGGYDPKGRKPVYKLRAAKKRDAPEDDALRLVRLMMDRAMSHFGLPADALELRAPAPAPPSLRHAAYNIPVTDWYGAVLAHARTGYDADRLSRYVRQAGDGAAQTVPSITQGQYRQRLSNSSKRLKMFGRSMGDVLYVLARLAISDTVEQAAIVVGYFLTSNAALAAVLNKELPDAGRIADAKPYNRMPPSAKPYGDPLNTRGVYAVLRVLEVLAHDEMALQVLGCDAYKAHGILIGMLRDLVSRVRYTGRLAARDRTKTYYNYAHQAEHYEVVDLDDTVAIAASRQAAMRIVKAAEYLGRKAALERANAVIDAYLSTDDLI